MRTFWSKAIAGFTIFSLMIFIMPNFAYAAIAKDATSTSTVCTTACASSISWTHTFGAITNGLIVVEVVHATDVTVSNVKIGANTFTQAATLTQSVSTASTIDMYYWASGSMTGAQTVTVTLSGTPANTDAQWASAVSASGADQTTPLDATATTHGGSGSTFTTTVATTKASDFIVDVVTNNANFTLTKGASQTQIQNASAGPSGTVKAASSYLTAVSGAAGNYSMTWASTFSQTYDQIVAAFNGVLPAAKVPAKVQINAPVYINSRVDFE